MDTQKTATAPHISQLLDITEKNTIIFDSRYRQYWASMLKHVAEDVVEHCSLLFTSLAKIKIPALVDLPVSSVPVGDFCPLFIPSTALVVTKLYKTFDLKLSRKKRGSLNASHARPWLRLIRHIKLYLLTTTNTATLQYIDKNGAYRPLRREENEYLTRLAEGIPDTADISTLDGVD